ncbi:6-hydroxymethylpterin diphosphokinase MptE-like protein [Hippea sp. KM1]|uniref:6-hydroxymethylpterin diphosphokinase MptE-like protein n=1 Tax=Hippea sp. KM1 TaxID=944481 RepID=UPI00046CBD48|nr:6-hydroxymethylpterin diphosphokinase MptE-like protein [Hippea sp. KM1]
MLGANRKLLKEKGILDIIENCKGDPNINIKDGRMYYKDMEIDEDMPVKEDNIKSIDTVFIHGFGMGNILRKLKKKFPKTVFVVLETNPCIIKEALSYKDFSDVLDNKTIPVILSQGNLEDNIKTLISLLERRIYWGEVVQFTTPGYRETGFYDVDSIKLILDKYLIAILVNRATLISRSRVIFENTVKNLPEVAKNGDVGYFYDAFKGKPAIVVASGPSLSKNIEYLKKVKGKSVIIAVDSVISVLKSMNIEPDFVCGVDYQEVNQIKYTPIFKEKEKSDYVFIAADGINYVLPKLFKKTFVEYSMNNFVSLYKNFLGQKTKKHFSFNAVTHLAVQFAYQMGCNPIIFVGQDWAFSGGEDHISGVVLDGFAHSNVIWVKGNYEDRVPTDQTLYAGLKIVEDIVGATKNEGITYINATEGGAYINGTEVMRFKDVMEEYLKEPIEKGFMLKEVKPRYDDFIKRTQEISDRLGVVIKKATKALSINNKVLKKWIKNKNVDEIRADVDKVNKLNDEITFDEVFSSTAQNFYFKEFYEFHREEIDIEGQDTKKRIEQSIKYFSLIKEKTIQTKRLIDELLEFLKLEKAYVSNRDKFLKDKDRLLRLAELYFDFKDLYTGIEFIDEALKLYPDDARLYYWRAKYCTLNRFMHKEALKNFERALELDPNFEKALFDYEVEKKMVQSHMILAKSAAERKDYMSARRLIERALDYEPENEKLKRWKDVINELATVTKNAQRQNLLLKQLELEGEAFEKYKTAIEFVKKEQMDKAFDILKELYDKYGNFADIPFLLGSIYIDKKEFDKAENYLKEAVELIPYQPLVYLALGKLYIEKEDYVAAKENLEKAVSMNPDLKPGVLDTLGNLYYEFGEYEKAFKAFEEYLQYSDDKIKTLTKIALCYKEMGMINEYNMLMEKIKSITGAN